jgi:uncharacterized membrane protein
MTGFYLFLLVAMVTLMLAWVAWEPRRLFEYPYFMAAVFGVFILPQAYSLINFPGGVSKLDIEYVLLMCVLCLGCAIVGYRLRPSIGVMRMVSKPVDPARMLQIGVALIIVGTLANQLMPRSRVEHAERGGLTGIATIYLFFGGLVVPGFAICLQLLRDKFTKGRLVAVVAGSVTQILSIFYGRREAALMFFLTIALTAYYKKGKVPRRSVIFGALFFAMVAIPATGVYRGLVAQGEARRVMEIRPIDNFVDFFTKESILELRNAAALINSTINRGTYGWGTGYWDQIVFRFVPAQFVGRDVKDSLMLRTTSERIYLTELTNNYEISRGSTNTGMGDSFEQFGWAGCLFFAALAMLFKSVWTASNQPDARFAQLVYIMIGGSAMRTVTHQTVDFLPGIIYQIVFLSLAYMYARVPARHLPQAQRMPQAPQVRPRGSRWN